MTLTQAAHPQTYGFIDSLALHGAFAALRGRDPRSWTEWETQNLLECTYLLLFRQMGLVPGPQARGTAAPGDESILVSRLPSLFALPDLNMTNANAQARSSVDAWCRLHATTLAAAWGKLTSRPDFDHWGQRMSDFFWEVHVKHHDGLFDPGHITLMQPLIGISEADLRDLHARSRDQATVKQWLAAPDSEPAVVGRSGYLISTLIRGKFHEFLAKHARAHLVQHPMRQYVSGRTSHVGEIVTLVSEELFVKMIIGRALAERSSDVRVSQWCESIDAARRALPDISFRRHNSYASAESAAAQACKSIGLFPGPSYQPNLLDWTLGLGVPIWLNLTLGFWPATLAGLAWGGYKVARGRGIGQDVAALLRREGDFTRLGRTVPGRIDRILVRGPNKSEAS